MEKVWRDQLWAGAEQAAGSKVDQPLSQPEPHTKHQALIMLCSEIEGVKIRGSQDVGSVGACK